MTEKYHSSQMQQLRYVQRLLNEYKIQLKKAKNQLNDIYSHRQYTGCSQMTKHERSQLIEVKQNKCAVTIQSLFRGYICRILLCRYQSSPEISVKCLELSMDNCIKCLGCTGFQGDFSFLILYFID